MKTNDRLSYLLNCLYALALGVAFGVSWPLILLRKVTPLTERFLHRALHRQAPIPEARARGRRWRWWRQKLHVEVVKALVTVEVVKAPAKAPATLVRPSRPSRLNCAASAASTTACSNCLYKKQR